MSHDKSGTDTNYEGAMKVDVDLVRELAEMLGETGLSEIEVEDGDRKIRVSRAAPAAAPMAYAPAPVAAPAPVLRLRLLPAAAPAAADNANAVKSPMVGTAYLSPEPGATEFHKRWRVSERGRYVVHRRSHEGDEPHRCAEIGHGV